MKAKNELSEAERYAWATLIATGVVFLMFWGRMTDGFQVLNLGAKDLLGLYLRVIMTFIVLHIIIAVIFAAKRGKEAQDGDVVERDERDMAIERKGSRTEFWVLAIIVQMVIFTLLFENAFPDGYTLPISVLSASGMFFVLMSGFFIADIAKRITMIIAYKS